MMRPIEERVHLFFTSERPQLGISPELDDTGAYIDCYCTMIANGEYSAAYQALRSDKLLNAEQKRALQSAINQEHLFERKLEWGTHGIRRSFRFWNDAQKSLYLREANRLVTVLADLTPHVTFGFGAVLGFIRENDFIAHDDDLDLLIALPSARATFSSAKTRLRNFLEAKGYTCHGENLSHFGVNYQAKGAAIDVFIGFIEDNQISWFPSMRSGLKLNEVFPTRTFHIYGEKCAIPNDPERYLEVTYGPNWREPVANWSHPWNQSEFADYI